MKEPLLGQQTKPLILQVVFRLASEVEDASASSLNQKYLSSRVFSVSYLIGGLKLQNFLADRKSVISSESLISVWLCV